MLREILAVNVFVLLLIFARLGSAMMLFAGFNSTAVPARARLLLAVVISFLLMPTLAGRLPAMPPDPMSMFLLIAGEVTVGLFFGALTQILITPMDIAGSSIGYAVGLTNMFTQDPVTAEQSQLLTGFLNLTAIGLVFLSDAHHMMLRALVDSYTLFVPGHWLPLEDFSSALVRTLGDSVLLGVKLASPLIVFSLTFNSALGLLNRLVPHMQVFFVGMPVQILGGLALLAICLPPIMSWFVSNFDNALAAFLSPG